MTGVQTCALPILASVVIYGIYHKKLWLIWLSLFLLSLTRATGVFLAPSFLAMTLLASDRKNWLIGLFTYLYTYLLPIAAGTAVFIFYEYANTHVWFSFFTVQKKYWGHMFSMPVLPFSNYSGPPLLWISSVALFIGVFCLVFMFIRFFKWLLKNDVQDNLLALSCSYLVMALFAVVFYNPTWGSNKIGRAHV